MFEAFETSATADKVLATKGALQWDCKFSAPDRDIREKLTLSFSPRLSCLRPRVYLQRGTLQGRARDIHRAGQQ